MKCKTLYAALRHLLLWAMVLLWMTGLALPAHATEETKTPYQQITAEHDGETFTYELFLTDQNGASVMNPRDLSAGDTLYAEIRLTRNDYFEPTYDSYGIEFRLLTRGLAYNNDGASLRSGTQIHRDVYTDGDSVGFAWYDMAREGEPFGNPVLAANWSYTVEDPAIVNITVPVALIYVAGDNEAHVPVGKARLYLDLNGGTLLEPDVSGEYDSGTKVTLPDAQNGDYVFEGWSDGVQLYPAGSQYTVSGIVTLTAQWAGLVRDRYVRFDPNGGSLISDDPSGYYADGEIITIPDAVREGYRLLGWNDGAADYGVGEAYTVYNTVTILAQWEPVPTEPDSTDAPDAPDDPGDGASGELLTGGLVGLLALFLLLLLLWKRRFVKYSLVNGDVALSYRNNKRDVRVAVILYDGDREYHLAKSSTVKAKRRLRYIRNMGRMPVAVVEPGKYPGKLIIMDGSSVTVKKCRVKVLDRELKKAKK